MADQKITQLNTLTKTSVAAADLIPIADVSVPETKAIRYDQLVSPQDTHFRIVGGADSTKQVAFEVDGLTTGTTRTLTISDEDGTVVTNNNTVQINNKTIGTGTKVAVGSDATGDTYYRDSSGNFTRLPIGSTNQILKVDATGVPVWVDNPAASNGSTTVAGIFEEATSAEINSGAATGATGARLAVTAAGLASSAPAFSLANATNANFIKLTRLAGYSVANNTTENTVYTTTVTGGLLSANGMIRVSTPFSFTNDTAAAETWTIRLKYGGSTLSTITVTLPAGSASAPTPLQGELKAIIVNNASTSAQNVGFYVVGGNILTASTNTTGLATYALSAADTTSAIDTTSNQTLTMTIQKSAANAKAGTFFQTIVETIKN